MKFFLPVASMWLLIATWVSPTTAAAQVMLNKAGWSVVFSDEFDDPATVRPGSTKWSNGYDFGTQEDHTLGTNEHYATWDNIEFVGDGTINLRTKHVNQAIPANGRTYSYTSGSLSSLFDDAAYSGCTPDGSPGRLRKGFLYGMFEIRCRVPKGDRRLAAFWLYRGPEYDVFEFDSSAPDKVDATVQPFPGLPSRCQTHHYNAAEDWNSDYHTYTFVWTQTAISYFIDGREIRTDTDPSHIAKGCDYGRNILCLDAEIRDGQANFNDQGSYVPFNVDYVRVYKPTNRNDIECTQTPYRESLAINRLASLNPNAYGSNKNQDGCYSPGAVPAREMDVNTNGQVYYRDNTNRMIQLSFAPGANGQWSMNNLNGNVSNVAGNVTCSKTASNIFYSDAAGKMWNFYYSNGWQSNPLLDNVTDVSNNVVVSTTASNVFYRNTANSLSNFYYDANGWHNSSIPQAGTISSCAGSIALSGTYLFYKGGDGYLRYIEYTSSGWSQPVLIGYPIGNSIVIKNNPTLSGLNSLQIFYIGNDSKVYNTYLDNGNWVSYPLSTYVHNAVSELVLSQDQEQLYYRGAGNGGNRLFNFYYYQNNWSSTPISYENSPDVKGALCMDASGKVFFQATDQSIWNTYSSPSRLENPLCESNLTVSNRLGMPTSNQSANGNKDTKNTVIKAVADFEVAPNPASDGFDVYYVKEAQGGVPTFTLTDVLGRTIKAGQLAGQNTHIITGDLSSGTYLLKVEDNEKVLYKRVQVNH